MNPQYTENNATTYMPGIGWSDLTELQCLLIMKKLERADFPRGMQADLCRKLEAKLEKEDYPLRYGSLSAKVSNYKSAAKHNQEHNNSTNTIRLYEKYKHCSVEELEAVISKMSSS